MLINWIVKVPPPYLYLDASTLCFLSSEIHRNLVSLTLDNGMLQRNCWRGRLEEPGRQWAFYQIRREVAQGS